jgi:hypothetical protein
VPESSVLVALILAPVSSILYSSYVLQTTNEKVVGRYRNLHPPLRPLNGTSLALPLQKKPAAAFIKA